MRLHPVSLFALAVSITSCSSSFDKRSVQAQAGAPISAQVEEVHIPLREDLPIYALVVEPVRLSQSSATFVQELSSGENSKLTVERSSISQESIRLSAQLRSALSNVKNFVVLDEASLRKRANGTYEAALKPNELGPFIVRTLITEYGTEVEAEGNNEHRLIYFRKDGSTKGVVALDVSVFDGRSGRMVGSFPAKGTFASTFENRNFGGIIPIYEQKQMARSTVDQALRVASIESAKQLLRELETNASTNPGPALKIVTPTRRTMPPVPRAASNPPSIVIVPVPVVPGTANNPGSPAFKPEQPRRKKEVEA